ncbi:MAG TPA: BON domain-containing protein [Gemmataceae bacterium]|nr:BON domain-containing protein [Gemmataceae bacterium]
MSILGWLDRWSGYAEFIAHTAETRLRQEPCADLRGVSCQWDEGVLTLRGRVRTAALRRIAEALARRMEEVHGVVNDIAVAAPDAAMRLRNRLTSAECWDKGKRHRH